MSYTEINHKKGMPYGGMPHGAILERLEETDPRLILGRHGGGLPGNADAAEAALEVEHAYDDFARAQLVDRTAETPWLEEHQPRRDPTISRTMINLRFNGGRGAADRTGPRHPDLFVGFTGNDPRGRDTYTPRIDGARAHTETRFRNHEVRMGKNVGHGDFQVADRPWGGAAQSYAMKEGHRRLQKYAKWFSVQKEGRPWGRNVVHDALASKKRRVAAMAHGREGLHVGEARAPEIPTKSGLSPTAGVRVKAFSDGAHGRFATETGAENFVSAEGGGVARRDINVGAADSAPWRNTEKGAALAVARYSRTAGNRSTFFSEKSTGGAHAVQESQGQELRESRVGPGTNQNVLGEGMGAAAAHRRAARRRAKTDVGLKKSEVAAARSTAALAANLGAAAKAAAIDHSAAQMSLGEEFAAPGRTGGPGDAGANRRRAAAAPGASAASRLADATAMVASLHGAQAPQSIAARETVVAGRLRPGLADAEGFATAGGAQRARDLAGFASKHSEMALRRAAAAGGLEVASYRQLAPADSGGAATAAGLAAGFAAAGKSKAVERLGRSKGPEHRGATGSGAQATTSGSDRQTFGRTGDAMYRGATVMGSKNARGDRLEGQTETIGAGFSETVAAPRRVRARV